MSPIAITHESALLRLAAEVRRAVPAKWGQLWRGPLNVIRIDERGAVLSAKRRRDRPTVLEIAPPLVLSKRLVIPAAGRRDLPFAVELLIGQDTPFAVGEVLADVRLFRSLPETGELAFDVRLIPRRKVVEALAQFRIKPSRVQAISIVGDSRPFGTAGLMRRAEFPLGSQWGWLVPVAITVFAGAAWIQQELGSRRAVVLALEERTAAELVTLRTTRRKLDELNAGDESQRTVREAFEGSASTFALLHAIRATLPVTTTVTRVQLQAGEFRFFVTTPDALQDIKALQEKLGDYEARIDGSVVDAAGGSQSTVFLLTQRSGP